MKFSTREDIEAPIERVFDRLSSFEQHENAARQRGAKVRLADTVSPYGLGTVWDVSVMVRGKERDVVMEIVRFDRPTDIIVDLRSRSITGHITCELFALARTRTRMLVAVELRPETLKARLLIQSLKLTKSSLDQKYRARIAEMVAEIEDHRRPST